MPIDVLIDKLEVQIEYVVSELRGSTYVKLQALMDAEQFARGMIRALRDANNENVE